MDCVDPDTLLEWLQTGAGEDRDIQLMALEQLCMLLLMSDNIDRCFESCPPRSFLPALCRIIMDDLAPDNVLEVISNWKFHFYKYVHTFQIYFVYCLVFFC